MIYKEALDWIHSANKFGSKLGLDNIRCLLEFMGNPHKKLKYVHVAGTNGKGSTASFINSILIEAGYKTGFFISPYIEKFTERIQINSEEISFERLAQIAEFVKKSVRVMLECGKNHPTEFEIITAIAFQYYMEENCDIVVLEVGLGGRFDATNIIPRAEVAVITKIDMDHTNILGNTLEKIAFEKAGIIKRNMRVVVYSQDDKVINTIKKRCLETSSDMVSPKFLKISVLQKSIYGQRYDYMSYKNLKIGLLGQHQVYNSVTALTAIEQLQQIGWKINSENIYRGLEKTRWPGRFEILFKSPLFIIDGAHNEDGIACFVDTFRELFPSKKAVIIFGVLKDKEYKKMSLKLAEIAKSFETVMPESPRALSAQELGKVLKTYCNDVHNNDTIIEAVDRALDRACIEDIVCAVGSLYFVGKVRLHIKEVLRESRLKKWSLGV